MRWPNEPLERLPISCAAGLRRRGLQRPLRWRTHWRRLSNLTMTDDNNWALTNIRAIQALSWITGIKHSVGEYVRWYFCDVNGVEGAWGLFKRQIYGIHHWVSEKHLQRYLDEVCYRYNSREMGEGERVNDLLDRVSGRLTHKALTSVETEI